MEERARLLFTGDFYGGNRISELIDNSNFEGIYNDFLVNLTNCDLSVTNLESVLLSNGMPILKTGPAIKSNPRLIEALKFAGFNLLTLANNHILDYGSHGLSETLIACEKHGVSYVGAGRDLKQATETFYKEINGVKIAIINVAENEWSAATDDSAGAHPLNPISNYYKIVEAKKSSDYVFVVVHGGHETYDLPSPRMKETYRFFADAGANMIIGHHSHCYSGHEVYNGCPIFYSLGNFIFDLKGKGSASWKFGYIVRVEVSITELFWDVVPFKQDGELPGTFSLNAEELQLFNMRLQKLNLQIQDDVVLSIKFDEFVEKMRRMYSCFIEPHENRILFALQNRKFFPSLLSKSKLRLFLNLVRCEAHRDILVSLLKSRIK